ncbi:glycosyltransferase family 4 protein [Lysobacter arenosi]|uniref:Glycosyltransferase family 4 protein n=1 Tax=Lysobacter arenosi TaxID=2795387 RepID=A0ABX7R9F6_9GAMM|nr:glycosyltransferase family 1 protein [Lysobacter arenosi]QSX73646.1 glycosyltransferase family 4 protein [Lysobacter arenosi]
MRIVMDLQGAQSESRYRGIGRYTLSLAQAVARRNRGHDIHVSLNGAFEDTLASVRQALGGLVPSGNIHVWQVPLPVRGMDRENARRINHAELIKEAGMLALAPDLIHVSSLFEGYVDSSVTSVNRLVHVPTIVTLYDMIPLLNPEVYLNPDPQYKAYYEGKLEHLKRADALLAISDSSAGEATNALGFDPARVFNISAACDSNFVQLPKNAPSLRLVKEKYGLGTDFILYTGGSDERKNLQRLVDAYGQLEPRQRGKCQLVLAGRMHHPHILELQSRAAAAGLAPEELIFTGYVSDHHLVALYNLCRFFIFPSWHEGFGLPVLEAMSCGAAVLAADASSVKEIVHERAALFDPFDVASIRERMAHFLDSDDDLDKLRRYSIDRARDYSWDSVADRFLDACERTHAAAERPADRPDAVDALVCALAHSEFEDVAEVAALADSIDRSVAPAKRKIMVDVTELAAHDYKTGIQRVTRAIVSEWMVNPPGDYQVQLVRIDRASRRYVCANEYASAHGAAGELTDTPLVCHAGDVFLGLDLVGDCVPFAPEWFQYFHNAGVTVAFVVYDILPVRHPEWWPGQGGRHHERWLRTVAGASDKLLCISKAVADDVVQWLDEQGVERRPEISWFHLGADIHQSAPTKGVPDHGPQLLERLRTAESFLMVGTLEPRKGHAQVLAAFEQLWAEGGDQILVIVGKQGWLVDELCDALREHPELDSRLFWLSGISDDYLDEIYAACSCLLAASEGEGFGLPLIEAAHRHMPVLARDLPVFKEVAGDHAYYFSGTEPEDVKQAVRSWVELYRQGAHPSTDGLHWLTWQQSAGMLAQALLGGVPARGGAADGGHTGAPDAI